MSLKFKKMSIIIEKKWLICELLLSFPIVLSGCTTTIAEKSSSSNFTIAQHRIIKNYYDGKENDLATAGLGLEGLREKEPKAANPGRPSAFDLRRSAIYNSYKKLLPLADDIGYGRIHAKFWNDKGGAVSGYETIAPLVFDNKNIAGLVMLQVPDNFNKSKPCLIATASSGSRGIYGAVGVVGAWGLSKRCAVVYTDKGTGVGFHWLTENKAHKITGELVDANEDVLFSAFGNEKVANFKEKYPYRLASKHTHSGENVDQYWGDFVLAAIEFAFAQLNEQFSPSVKYGPDNTLVIGAGISNGGAAILRAAEAGGKKAFDGIVVSEPAINLPFDFAYDINRNEEKRHWKTKTLAQRAVIDGLFIPCAALFHDNSGLASFVMPIWQSRLETRCRKLKAIGALNTGTLQEQSQEAYDILRDNGLSSSSDGLMLAFTTGFIWDAVLVNYINAYGAYSIDDHLCGLSYAYTGIDGKPASAPGALKQSLHSVSGGILPAAGVTIINDNSKGEPSSQMTSLDADGAFDLAFDNLLCLRETLQESRVRSGIAKTFVDGDLHSLPSIIVHGREDNLIHVNHSSRAYYVLNAKREKKSRLHYYEIDNGQHFDALVALPPFKTRYVPVHHYFEEALDIMFDNQINGSKIPPSQRVKTKPAKSLGGQLTENNMPQLLNKPDAKIWINDNGEFVLPAD